MYKAISLIAVLALALAATPASSPSSHPVKHKAPATPAPIPKIPIIATVVSKPFCSALLDNVRPIVGLMIQSDALIGKSRPIFEDYLRYESNGESSGGMRDITLVRMENLVTPLVTSLAQIDRLLGDTAVYHYPPRNADDRRLLELRDKLQAVEATQKASLDVINGFVDSEQLAQLQLEGNDTNKAITGSDTTQTTTAPTPPPYAQEDPNVIPGLPQNPYTIDPATIPGLSLGSNPIRHVIEGLQWTQSQASQREVPVSKIVVEGVALCGGHASSVPVSVTPSP